MARTLRSCPTCFFEGSETMKRPFIRTVKSALAGAVLLAPSFSNAQNLPSQEDFQGALYICSGGLISSQTVSGDLDVQGFVRLLRRNIEVNIDATGTVSDADLGLIFDKIASEDGSLAAFEQYQQCLVDFVLPIISNGVGSAPGMQTGSEFTAVIYEVMEIDDLTIVSLGLSDFGGSAFLGSLPDTFRGISSTGSIYALADTGGLENCRESSNWNICGIRVDPQSKANLILTFERAGGRESTAQDGKTFRFTGNLVYAGSEYKLGMSGLPVVRVD